MQPYHVAVSTAVTVFTAGTFAEELLGQLRSSESGHDDEGIGVAFTSLLRRLVELDIDLLFCGWICHLKGSSGQDNSGRRRETVTAGSSFAESSLRYKP